MKTFHPADIFLHSCFYDKFEIDRRDDYRGNFHWRNVVHFIVKNIKAKISHPRPRHEHDELPNILKLISLVSFPLHIKFECQSYSSLRCMCVNFFGAFSRLFSAFVYRSCACRVHRAPHAYVATGESFWGKGAWRKRKSDFRQTNQRRINASSYLLLRIWQESCLRDCLENLNAYFKAGEIITTESCNEVFLNFYNLNVLNVWESSKETSKLFIYARLTLNSCLIVFQSKSKKTFCGKHTLRGELKARVFKVILKIIPKRFPLCKSCH